MTFPDYFYWFNGVLSKSKLSKLFTMKYYSNHFSSIFSSFFASLLFLAEPKII